MRPRPAKSSWPAVCVALLVELQGVLLREKFARQIADRSITVADVFAGYKAAKCATVRD